MIMIEKYKKVAWKISHKPMRYEKSKENRAENKRKTWMNGYDQQHQMCVLSHIKKQIETANFM